MKKTALTLAILLGFGLSSFADPYGGGMFGRGESTSNGDLRNNSLFAPTLPSHGQSTNQSAPLGGGIFVLTAFGAAYLLGKRRKDE